MKNVSIIAFLAAVFSCSKGEDKFVPSYITPCDATDAGKFEECVRKQIEISLPHFAKGIPELGVPSIDPVSLDDIKLDGNGLKLLLSDARMRGLGDSKVTQWKISLADEMFTLAVKTNIDLTGQYTIDGQILILPIQGKGDAEIKAQNIEVVIKGKLAHTKGAKGDHFKLVTPNYTYNIEKTTFKFENLFNGNKPLAEVTHQFANENWQQIMDDLAPPAVKQIVKNIVKVINKFFAKVTINQIVENYKSQK